MGRPDHETNGGQLYRQTDETYDGEVAFAGGVSRRAECRAKERARILGKTSGKQAIRLRSSGKPGKRRNRNRASAPSVFLHAAARGKGSKSKASRKGQQAVRRMKIYNQGYKRGYEDGVRQGKNSFGAVFDGVSIVIPTYNQKDYVLKCVSSIEKHTPAPYEIIVVDNGSQDGTANALRRIGGMVRVAALDGNRGFAGGVNHGLMMAKGRHIVVLNNDTLVTPGWLDNMMACLQSQADIGVVGPVTNYIGGEQQIEVPYDDISGMWAFAANYNRPDASKHRLTDRLVGFCWLFSRELFERVGYLDEGYAIGNFEDDDWIVRAKLAGYKLAVAGDAFIHHFGSVSMKAVEEQRFAALNKDNEQFYERKWGDPHALIAEVARMAKEASASFDVGERSEGSADGRQPFRRSSDFYPEGSFLTDVNGDVYHLSGGCRRKLHIPVPRGISPVRLAKPDLLGIPVGNAIDSSMQIEGKASDSGQSSAHLLQGSSAEWPEGSVVAANEAPQIWYQISGGKRRKYASAYAAECWGVYPYAVMRVPYEKLHALEEGWPIIAPPKLLGCQL